MNNKDIQTMATKHGLMLYPPMQLVTKNNIRKFWQSKRLTVHGRRILNFAKDIIKQTRIEEQL